MMKYKIVVFDLDGTLLNDNKQIDISTIEILKDLNDKGIKTIIATGRNYFEAKNLTKKLDFKKIIMANNGCIVRDSVTDKIIYEKYLEYNTFVKIYEEGIKRGLNPVIHINEYNNGYDIVIELETNNENYFGYISGNNRRFKIVNVKDKSYDNILSVCYLGEYDKLGEFEKKMKDDIGSTFNSICSQNLKIKALLEYMNVNGCKWKSIKEYAKSNNINPDEIVAFGDDNNDINMVMNSGLGIAMKNGTKKIKEVADIVSTFDNNDLGVKYEIEKIFY